MDKFYYSIIGFIAIIVHLILNYDMFSKPKEKDNRTIKSFHVYLISVLFYYITDALWGILDYSGLTKILYVDTVAYYISMSFSIVFCCSYIISFLNLNKFWGKVLRFCGGLFCFLEISVLIINFFNPVFFYFDADGNYHAGFFRHVALVIQIIMFGAITFISFLVAINKSVIKTRRNIVICLFGFVMTVTIIAQAFFPLVPLYSIGLMIGTCILHVFIQEDFKNEQFEVLDSLAEIFYSMHVIDLQNDTLQEFNAKNEVKQIADHRNGAAQMMKDVMQAVIDPQYMEEALKFTDVSTIAERMQNKKIISGEFIGNRIGWFLASFITMEADLNGRPTKVIFTSRSIDDFKRQQEKLIRKTQTDEMTGLLNRRAYEEDIYAHNDTPVEDNFNYVSIDVNGLKVVNDSLGHTAGDELLIGACQCMKQIFGPVGRIYRIGGDEFVAILFCKTEQMDSILRSFDDAVSNWSGELVKKVSVSYGWISKEEQPSASVRQLGAIAEKRMYEAKSAYYRKQGVDRRGQQDAHKALCELYTKILKINITEDSYQIVNMDVSEQTKEKGFASKISEWFKSFGKSGQVHEDDLEEYLRLTDLSYMSKYFKDNKTSLHIFYRRRIGKSFKHVMMEIITANDYSNENQSLFLYVKSIEK